jgi:predicted nucleic acid-binding protein
MNHVFADTCYWFALLNRHDPLHQRAKEAASRFRVGHIVTSEPVLTELLNLMRKGARLRKAGVDLVRSIRDDPGTTVEEGCGELFSEALDLYAARTDKEWNHTDCSSFCIMKTRGLAEALTYDEHFVQAGHRALLRD